MPFAPGAGALPPFKFFTEPTQPNNIDDPPFGVQTGAVAQIVESWFPDRISILSASQVFTAVEVDNPPPCGSPSVTPCLVEKLVSWQAVSDQNAAYEFIGGRSPFFPKYLPPSITAVPVNNPPFAQPGRMPVQTSVAAAAYAGQQDQNAAYIFIGGRGPYMPRVFEPNITAVQVNTPLPSVQGQFLELTWWLPPDTAPQLTPRLAQGPPPSLIPSSGPTPETLSAWYDVAGLPILPRALPAAITAVPANEPPYSQVDPLPGILIAWTPPPPQAPVAGNLNASLEAVRVDNPPFGFPSPSLTAIAVWHIPPPPQAPVAGNLNPSVESVRVDGPPFSQPDPVLGAILSAWIPPPPQPIVAGNLSPSFEAVRVDTPPLGQLDPFLGILGAWLDAPSALQAQQHLPQAPAPYTPAARPQDVIVASWQPAPAQPVIAHNLNPAFESVQVDSPPFSQVDPTIGILSAWIPPAPSPIVAGLANPSSEAVRVDNPAPRRVDAVAIANVWAAPDAAPQLPRYLPQGQVASQPFARPQDAIVASWQPISAAPVTARPLNPAFEAVRVDTPPFGVPSPSLTAIAVGHIPPPPQPVVAGNLIPAAEAVGVDNPPFGQVDPLPGVLASWIPPPPQAPVAGQLSPVFEAVPVNNPPVLLIDPAMLSSILIGWIPPPPQPIVAGALAPAIEGTRTDNPPFAGLKESRNVVLAAWIPPPPAPIVAGRVNPVFEAVKVDNPSFGQADPLIGVLGAWIAPDVAQQVQRYVPPVPAPAQTSFVRSQDAILTSWQLAPSAPVVARNLNPAFEAVRVDAPPVRIRVLQDLQTAWVPPQPQPQTAPNFLFAGPPTFAPAVSHQLEIVASWLPDARAPVTARAFSLIPSTDNPPPRNISTHLGVIYSVWAIPPAPVLNPVFIVQRADPPLFVGPRRIRDTILAAWVPPPPAPIFALPTAIRRQDRLFVNPHYLAIAPVTQRIATAPVTKRVATAPTIVRTLSV